MVLWAVVMAGLLPSAARAALTDPAQIMNEAYINLVQGDQSLDANRLDEALVLYTQAQEYYVRLAREFPGFEPRIIQYRKTYCDNQITDIQRKLTQPAGGHLPPLEARAPAWPASAAPSVAAAMPAPAIPSEPAATERSVEIDYLKSRIDSLEAELAEHDIRQAEMDRLAAANQTLEQQLQQARRQLTERATGEQEAVQTLRAEMAAKDEQLQALQRDLSAKRELDQALHDMEAQASELRGAAERLNEEIKTLDLELDDAEIRADQAELRAEQAENKLAAAQTRVAIAEEELQVARAVSPSAPAAKKTAKTQKPAPADHSAQKKSAAAPEPPQVSTTPSAPPRPIPDGMSAADFVRQLLQEGQNEAALATIQNARRAARSDVNLGLIEGITLIRLQRYSDAAALLIDLAKQNPRNAEVHATLGAAMMGAGFYDEARDTLQMAIGLDKNLPECQYNLAQLYAFIEPINPRLAKRHYRNALNLGVAPDAQLEEALK